MEQDWIGLTLVGSAYILGSLPFSYWLTGWRKGIDIRQAGSGHASATNAMRQAGWGIGILVLCLDISKGFIPIYLLLAMGFSMWHVAAAAALAVVGHCWPLFANFRGGMGLATTGGAMLAISPLATLIGLAVLIVIILIIRHTARAAVIAAMIIPVLFTAIGFRGEILLTTWVLAPIIGARFFQDWNRRYRELWLDRET